MMKLFTAVIQTKHLTTGQPTVLTINNIEAEDMISGITQINDYFTGMKAECEVTSMILAEGDE